jgi:tRNA(adenine34) deaminase
VTDSDGGAAPADAASDQHFMRRAIVLAQAARHSPGRSPIGCVIVLDGTVVGQGCNEVGLSCDPTAHAEIVAIRRATGGLATTELRGATLYSTLQPCGMCTMASIWARVGRIVCGAERHQVHSMYFEDRHLDAADFLDDAFRKHVPMTSGVLGEECSLLYFKPGDAMPLAEQGNV